VLLVAFVAVVGFALVRGRNEAPELQAEIEAFARTRTDLALNLVRFALAVALLYYGSRLVVVHAPVLGAGLGMNPLLTGLLPVAVGTALPEMAAAITAARRGQGDLVAGHVIGSSLFNLLLVVGGMAVFNPLPLPESFVRFELPAALVFALMMVPVLRGDLRVSKREGGVLLVALLAWVAFELLMIQR
ncbi:MAG TPA: hypothetical protein VGD25_03480, partial [Immundisolibacter sp.]